MVAAIWSRILSVRTVYRIEIRQRLEGEDMNLHLFAIRVLEDEARYEVKLSGDAEHKTVKPPEWLSLLHDKLARIARRQSFLRFQSDAPLAISMCGERVDHSPGQVPTDDPPRYQ
jgi:hypothetical protein